MVTRRYVLTGIVAAPAVIAADHLMKVHSLPERYATVYGVGWDLEVIEHPIWEPMSVAYFGGTSAIDKFREVTDFVHSFPIDHLPKPERLTHWNSDQGLDPLVRWSGPVVVKDNGFTNVCGYLGLYAWQESLRPDLNGRSSVEWIQEQIDNERKYGGEPDWLKTGLRA